MLQDYFRYPLFIGRYRVLFFALQGLFFVIILAEVARIQSHGYKSIDTPKQSTLTMASSVRQEMLRGGTSRIFYDAWKTP